MRKITTKTLGYNPITIIKGKNAYLYRAVDSKGKIIDFFVSEHRDKAAARKFFKKALNAKHNQRPRVITTDRYKATEIAIIEETYYGDISCTIEHRMCKYLNNIIEQDHRFIKKKIDPMLGFKTLDSSDENNHRNRNYAYDTQRADQRYSVCPV